MPHETKNQDISMADYASEIFYAKDRFHKSQAKLPIEKKIQILIELQKMVLNIQKDSDVNEFRKVWDLK